MRRKRMEERVEELAAQGVPSAQYGRRLVRSLIYLSTRKNEAVSSYHSHETSIISHIAVIAGSFRLSLGLDGQITVCDRRFHRDVSPVLYLTRSFLPSLSRFPLLS
jgi:hypothetical protein